MKRSITPARNWLLYQRFVAGVGNIYANEALFRAGVRPQRRSNTVTRAQAQCLHRLEEKFLQLLRPFLIAPIADPDDLAPALIRNDRPEEARVRGLMPGPDAPRPTSFEVVLPHRFAEGENAIIAIEIVDGHRVGIGRRAVMGVMEEQLEPSAAAALLAQA